MRTRAVTFAVVVAGGAIGTTARWAVGEGVSVLGLPDAGYLLIVNLLGAFLLGWFIGSKRAAAGHPNTVTFVAAGVLGSFTTFSGFAVESVLATEAQSRAMGLAFALVSVVLGVVVAAAGRMVAR